MVKRPRASNDDAGEGRCGGSTQSKQLSIDHEQQLPQEETSSSRNVSRSVDGASPFCGTATTGLETDDASSSPATTAGTTVPVVPVAPSLSEFGNHPFRYRPRLEWYTPPTSVESCYRDSVVATAPAPSPSATAAPTTVASPVDSKLETTHKVAPLSRPQTLFGREWDTALHVCIQERKTAAALVLINEYCAPGCSAVSGPLDIVSGACSIDVPNAHGVTPLMVAAQRGDLLVTRALLQRGASLAAQSATGFTAILKAAHFGHAAVLRELLDSARVDVVEVDNSRGTTPLMRAAQEGHVDAVRCLLEHGATVNRRNLAGVTALMLAAQRGHAGICELLLRHGADVHAKNSPQNSSALHLACRRGHADAVLVLVRAGSELLSHDARGRTARMLVRRELPEPQRRILLRLLDPTHQVYLWQVEARKHRNWVTCKMWHLLQQERAYCFTSDNGIDGARGKHGDDNFEAETVDPDPGSKLELSAVSIHQVQHFLDVPPCSLSVTHPYEMSSAAAAAAACGFLKFASPSLKALLRTMSLPAPLFQLIAQFLPLPNLWSRRLKCLTESSFVDATATVQLALDLVDEILEEGGLVEAFAVAQVPPPHDFDSWREWKRHLRLRGDVAASTSLPPTLDPPRQPTGLSRRLDVTTATVPPPGDPQVPCAIELRRQAGYLALVSRHPILQRMLTEDPFDMEADLVSKLCTLSDLALLVRRMIVEDPSAAMAADGPGPFDALVPSRFSGVGAGDGSIAVGPAVAMDVIMLASLLGGWYCREREPLPVFQP